MKQRSRFLTSALLVGCLDNVNLVNARSVGREAGVEVTVSLCDGVDGVTVSCDNIKVCGTVLGQSPVLTGLNDATFDLVSLSGTMVVAKATTLCDLISKLSQVTSVSPPYVNFI